MADDNYDDATADNYAAGDDAVAVNDDDFYSMNNVTDDYTNYADYYSTANEGDDYYSAKMATNWIDKLLSNSTSTEDASLSLSPVQDATPESILAALALNTIACILLLSLYEILRRLIPSVYSQRLVNEKRALTRHPNLRVAMAGNNDAKEEADEGMTCSMPSCRADSFLEWVLPVYQTPWSTIRELAGLDAYFYLRYIRMCLKLTLVSSFWAMVILCPVYASGGGGQSGCYYFSMANVLPGNKFRVWVPTIFQWCFSLYISFCIRAELSHYVELRQQFLGGLDEVKDTKSRNYRSPDAVLSGISSDNSSDTDREIRQHRYSLLIEKVPVALRSNVALYSYFDQLFPGQVHSASIAMNVPDLDQMSARRLRVCRRLEKSVSFFRVTGQRPTHIAGRPRFKALGIESEPFSLCDPEQCGGSAELSQFDDGDGCASKVVYETLPEKGQRVDSIAYYTLDLALGNIEMRELQQEKFRIAETGTSPRQRNTLVDDGIDESHCDWYGAPLKSMKQSAKLVAEGLRYEFEVSGEEDYLGDGLSYGSFSSSPEIPQYTKSKEKDAPLVNESHLQEPETPSPSKKSRSRNRPHAFLRALAWRMGIDFLSSMLDYVRTKTDVMVDNISRPSMSSTGFVTFTQLTPVTVTASASLTYKNNYMEVSVAPEPRDILWPNVQVDADIGASRSFTANVLLGLGVILWSIPLTLIQAWAKVENVAKIPGFEGLANWRGGAYTSMINSYLPVIALLGLILLLPLIFDRIAILYEQRKTRSGVENSIVGRYFWYQLANIYITVTAGTIWTSLSAIIDHPQQLLVILGASIPKLAGYFISLLITKTFAGLPMVLLRVGALSRMFILRSCFNKKRLTERELNEVYRKQPLMYGWEYPNQFLVIIICFTYVCLTPFVLPFGCIYFSCALMVYKKQLLYVYSPTYESGGLMFPQAIQKTLLALLISQLTFIGYTLIRKGLLQVALLMPLPFLTVFFTIHMDNRYVRPSMKLSLERAVRIDRLESENTPNFSDVTYQQPVLTEGASVPDDNDNEVLTEVLENLAYLQQRQDQPPRVA
mmetsp:Transcript_29380/g.66372  ORF Transcript_29380/g.66372 Transcript_29380/m.66372 type:complete len:1055 (-) Transcript_29380:9-3173(-)